LICAVLISAGFDIALFWRLDLDIDILRKAVDEAAGYPADAYEPFRRLGLNYDFYLTYGLKQPHYSQSWRLYYPKDLKFSKHTRQ
jgi:hypothetical protein